MKLTPDQQKDYDRLSPKGRKYYDISLEDNPEWSHEQRMTFVYINAGPGGLQDIITRKPKHPLKEVLLEVLNNMDSYFSRNFPNLYPKVASTIKGWYNTLKSWVDDVRDFLTEIFS